MFHHLPTILLRGVAEYGDPYAPSPTAVARVWRHEFEIAFRAALQNSASFVLPAAKQLSSELEMGRAELIRFEHHLLANLTVGGPVDETIMFTREPLEIVDAAHAHILIRVRRGATILFSSYGPWRPERICSKEYNYEENVIPTQTTPERPKLTTATAAFHQTANVPELLKKAAQVINAAWGTSSALPDIKHGLDALDDIDAGVMQVDAFALLTERDSAGRYCFRSAALVNNRDVDAEQLFRGAEFIHEIDNFDDCPNYQAAPTDGFSLWDIKSDISLTPDGDDFESRRFGAMTGTRIGAACTLSGSSSDGLAFEQPGGHGGRLDDSWLTIRVHLKTELSVDETTQYVPQQHSVESVSLEMLWQFSDMSQHSTLDLLLNRLAWQSTSVE